MRRHFYTMSESIIATKMCIVSALGVGAFLLSFAALQPQVAYAAEITVQRPTAPAIMVKVGDSPNPAQFTSDGMFVLEDENRNVVKVFAKDQRVTIFYKKKNGNYKAKWKTPKGKTKKFITKTPLQVTPVKRKKRIIIENFQQRPSWNQELNDNAFYQTIRVKYSPGANGPVLVNDIGLEKYTRGIAETGGYTQPAYVKALLTAARTYAYYHVRNCNKYPGEPFCIDDGESSQVYRGANYSDRAPGVVAAQKATSRRVITYNGEGIIAPYFSRSDGRTRAWSDVWYGDQPWAKAVDDPCCTGQSLWGHGVGMSGAGARYFADHGWGWKKILKYYYSGVKISKGYK